MISSLKELVKKYLRPFYMVYRYFSHDRQKKKENQNFKRNGLDVLKEFDRCLSENGFKYMLAFGSALGAVREKGFIPHDDDIDTWMWIDDYKPELISILEKYGFRYKFSFTIEDDKIGKQDTFEYKGVLVDIFYLYPSGSGEWPNCMIFCNYPDCSNRSESVKKHGGLLPLKCSLPISRNIKRVVFEDTMMPVPENYDEVMKERYGEDYMIPQPKWDKRNVNQNHVYLHDKVGLYKQYC